MIERSSKEKTAEAKAFKLSKPGEETEAFKAAEKRRASESGGFASSSAVGPKIRTYAEAVEAGDDICKNSFYRCQ